MLNLRRCVFVGVCVCLPTVYFYPSTPIFYFFHFNDFKFKANELLYKRDELIGNITNKDDELAAKEDVLKVCFISDCTF